MGRARTRRPSRLRLIGIAGLAFSVPSFLFLGAQAQPAEFTFGSGAASANILEPAVLSGQLRVNVLAGQAISAFQDRSANGKSSSFEVPFLALTSGSKTCGEESSTGAGLPEPVRADTADNGDREPASAAGDQQGTRQSVEAAPGASAATETVLGAFDLPMLASVDASRAATSVLADPDAQRRVAESVVEIGDLALLGGVVRIKGLRWSLEQVQVGPDDRSDERTSTATFELGSIDIGPGLLGGPVSIPGGDLEQSSDAIDQANQVLARLGVQLRLPEVVSDPLSDSHSITPLTVALGGEEWLLGPVIGSVLTDPVLQEMTQLVLDNAFDTQDCKQLEQLFSLLPNSVNASWNRAGKLAPLLIAVFAGAVGGTGEVQINVGGVSTTLDDTYFAPIDFGGTGQSAPDIGIAPGAPFPAGTSAVPAPTAISTGAGTAGTGTPQSPAAQFVSTSKGSACRSTSPAGRPGCLDLSAAPLGVLAVALASCGLLLGDEIVRRRGRAADQELDA